MQIADFDNVQSATSDPDSNCNDQAYLVLNSEKENFAVEIIDRVFDPSVFSSSEQSLHKEVTQLVHEKQDGIFVQESEKVSFDEFMVDDRENELQIGKFHLGWIANI